MIEYKVGDRVRCILSYDNTNIVGLSGTVIKIYSNRWRVEDFQYLAIEFDENIDGHHCGMGGVKYGHGWNISADHLEPEQQIYGPPCPEYIINERKVKEKARKTWNNSNFVVKHSHLKY